MENNDDEKPAEVQLPFACITPEGVLVGVLPDAIDYTFFTESLTAGRYSEAGSIASFAICPRAIDQQRAGILLALQFPGPDGQSVVRVEVGRITYASLINCMAAIVHGMQETDLLKHEPGGDQLTDLLTAEEKARSTIQ
jgi:hypothetical protein